MNNVTAITEKQPQAAARFTIAVTIDGFPVQVEVEGKADALRGMIDRLKAIGAEPPNAKPEPTKAAPRCPVHNSEMKSGRRGYYCPKKTDGGEYCKEVA